MDNENIEDLGTLNCVTFMNFIFSLSFFCFFVFVCVVVVVVHVTSHFIY